MKTKEHLPLFGSGPVYVITTSIITFIALIIHYKGLIPTVDIPSLFQIVIKIVAVFFIIAGLIIWTSAVFISKATQNIKKNNLITNGVYSIVRHPIYSAFTLAEWGLLLYTCNLWFLIFVPLYWIYFTLLIKNTEEKWLRQLYGDQYENYCKKVNRCIPWFPKRRKDQ